MNTGMISQRYATALLSFATASKQEKTVYEKAQQFATNFAEELRLHKALENPVVAVAIKKELILAASGKKANPVFERFVELVFEKNRESYFQNIMLKYIDLYRENQNIYSGKLITAITIDAITEKKLISVIESQKQGKFEVHKSVNPDLIGGFILEVNNTRWDASLKRQLQTIKNEIVL